MFCGRPAIAKQRFNKTYRHPDLDKKLTSRRLVQEGRLLLKCLKANVPVPTIWWVDMARLTLYMERIDGPSLRDYLFASTVGWLSGQSHTQERSSSLSPMSLDDGLAQKVGESLAKMHDANIIHGDLTTSNILCQGESSSPVRVLLPLVIIDFGLGYISTLPEDKAVDLYVLERAFFSTHPGTEDLFQGILQAYRKVTPASAKAVLHRLEDVRLRGRKRSMVG
ncbi:kinase-like domain-containing protein [Piptocephalis cylindrospora]|uniref:non-specific serine/threonine protein kinase n=1 Tax=Piptocephalis cylindrospora TaxID=1907219 RepID=A0A4P9Y668_9FUNG|nr:kinase-like domain-containing protein [Piptocephalis cylindrospora]|eukprot:RKP13721.1 kinase-like domain-containing protein [Piptocephalis cylindrospora]